MIIIVKYNRTLYIYNKKNGSCISREIGKQWGECNRNLLPLTGKVVKVLSLPKSSRHDASGAYSNFIFRIIG